MGALSYADDITISCPSLYGLSIMLDICYNFAHESCITFNTNKTVCIKFGEIIKPQEFAKLDGQLLKWQTDVRHLGNYLNNTSDNYVASNIKYSHFIGQFNHLKSKFGFIQPDILVIYLSNIVVHFTVRFYRNTAQMDLTNAVHNGINQLGIYFIYLIMLIVGY